MICAWEELLKILPSWMQEDVNRLGKEDLRELRLRRSCPPELILGDRRTWLRQLVRQQDLDFCLHAGSRYSPWTASSLTMGYLTVEGGHRIGVCGEAVSEEGTIRGIRNIRSLCVRVARDHPGIGKEAGTLEGSLLILGAPGWGKTTLLRDVIRYRSQRETVSVIDERGELFPPGFEEGVQTDILTGYPKASGVLQALKTMGPQVIAVDEITAETDCQAICKAARCGASLLATVHATELEELKHHNIYKSLFQDQVFDYAVILQKNQTYRVERVDL